MKRFRNGSFALPLVAGALVFLISAPGCLAGPEEERARSRRHILVAGSEDEPADWLSVIAEDEGTGAFLGVGVEEETERPEGGARITHVVDDSPAADAGLKKGDIIVRFDGKPIHGPVGLTKKIRSSEPGTEVRIEVVRKEKPLTLTAELGERKSAWRFLHGDEGEHGLAYRFYEEGLRNKLDRLKDIEIKIPRAPHIGTYLYMLNKPKLGVQLVPDVTPELREHLGAPAGSGVLVGKVLRGMPAEQAGIRVGDLIVAVDGEEIADTNGLIEAVDAKQGREIEIDLIRDRKPVRVKTFIPNLESEDEHPTGPRAMIDGARGQDPLKT